MSEAEAITCRVSTDETPSETVVRAIATLENEDPTTLHPPLYDAIDPGSLDRLVQSFDGGPGSVTFEYHDYTVTVTGDGTIRIADHRS